MKTQRRSFAREPCASRCAPTDPMNEQLVQRVKQCPNLPSLPAVAVQVLELAQRADVDIAHIARVISKDPALSAKILRTVNSSFYGRSHPISTISQALVILGLQSVKTLVLGFSLVRGLTANQPKTFKHLLYWKRSIFAATAARLIAAKISLVQQEEAFLAALLMDIGMLVLDLVLGAQYGELTSSIPHHVDLPEVERDELQMTHAEVGGIITEQWKLPPELTVPVAHHHDASQVQDETHRKLAELAFVSGCCADVYLNEPAADAIADARQMCLERYQWSEADCDALLGDIGKRTKEVASMLEINIGSPAEYDAILAKANEALRKITLGETGRQAKKPRQAARLVNGTEDPTGLAERARLDQFLADTFAAAQRGGQPMSLLIVEPDQLEQINGQHGQAVGDALLKHVAKLLRTARPHDLAARRAAGQLALVLPGASRQAACSCAETIRRAASSRAVACGATSIQLTVSVGVSCFDPKQPFGTVAQFTAAADLALANARQGGGNRVRAFSLKPARNASQQAEPAASKPVPPEAA
jgi:diguanylate cyclase (GGDEF)-like protein